MKKMIITILALLAIVYITLNIPLPKHYVGSYPVAGPANASEKAVK